VGRTRYHRAEQRTTITERGSSTISPGVRTWVELVVEPGTYRFTCFVPSPERGALHSQLGMTTTLTVDEPP
jgi:uncharacterized cupredoxin-like copper-binding protein